jgi:hypothetical protein
VIVEMPLWPVRSDIMNPLLSQLELLLPLACAWVEQQEQTVLQSGVPLAEDQFADARRVGVFRPEQVRLLQVAEVPVPDNPTLAAAARAVGLVSPFTVGLTVRYGIFIRAQQWGRRRLVAHELAHVMQYERCGGIEPFLRQYLHECATAGYSGSMLEREADRIEREVGG